MRVPILFNTWKPGVDPVVLGSSGLYVAQNCIKKVVGYGEVGSFNAAASAALAEKPCGSRGVIRSSVGGWNWNYVGTANHVYRMRSIAAGFTDVSSGAYALTAGERWDFCQFNDYICACAPGQPMEASAIGGGPLAAVANAPQAQCCMTVDQHVVLGDVVDGGGWGLGTMKSAVWWSVRGNHASWLQPGTAAAIAAQTDYRILSGDGGDVMALVESVDSGLVFQRNRVSRMTYVGGDVMFTFETVVPDKGCWVQHGAIATAVGVFFLHSDGLYLFDGENANPIGGAAYLNDYFSKGFVYGRAYEIALAVHDERKEVWLLHPKTPNYTAILIYNWLIDEFTLLDAADVEWIWNVFSGDTSGVELRCFDTTHDFGEFAGLPYYTATLTTGDIEFHPGRRSTVKSIRILRWGQGGTITCKVGVKGTPDGTITWSAAKSINSWGEYDCSEDGRYHRIEVTCSGAWTAVSGIQVEVVPSGEM